ncbi:MAG: alanine racemase [Nannocystaceae bacterium]|nr:alanine racemase [Nannocystaceae bacterium]
MSETDTGEVTERWATTLADIAREHGTPCFVYLVPEIDARIAAIAAALPGVFSVSYAMKANPNPALLRALARRVPRVDVSSGGELTRALECGFAPAAISFTGPAKSDAELALALGHGVEVVLESRSEARRLSALAHARAQTAAVLVRIAPTHVPAGFGDTMAGRPTAFGIDEDEIDDALREIAALPNLVLEGLHAYSGTQCLRADAIAENWGVYAECFRALASRHGLRPRRLVFGSGLGIAHHDGQQTVAVAEVATRARAALDGLRNDPHCGAAELVLETGRYLVGEAGVYLTRVVTRKRSRGSEVAICDGGMNHHLAAAGHLGMVVRRPYRLRKLGARGDEPRGKLLVCGPLCTSLDGFARDLELPALHEGDVLAVVPSGAYALTSSPLGFISHPPPAEHVIEAAAGRR